MTSVGWNGAGRLPPVRHVPQIGRIDQFDGPRGIGIVDCGNGRKVGFHCTAITDGSRDIAVGTLVAVVITTGHLGHLEASSLRPLPGAAPGRSIGGPEPGLRVPVESGGEEAGGLGGSAQAGVAGDDPSVTPVSGTPVVSPTGPDPPASSA